MIGLMISFSISPSNGYSVLISSQIDWSDFLYTEHLVSETLDSFLSVDKCKIDK